MRLAAAHAHENCADLDAACDYVGLASVYDPNAEVAESELAYGCSAGASV